MSYTVIPYIRSATEDTRPSRFTIDAILANSSFSRRVRSHIADAFEEAGLISGSKISAAAATDATGRLLLANVDRVIAEFDIATRFEIKTVLHRAQALSRA